MKIQWTSHLKDEEAKERFQKRVLSAKPVFERLDFLVNEKLKAIDSNDIDTNTYYAPGWEGWQAHRNGEKAAFKYIRNLINLDQEDK